MSDRLTLQSIEFHTLGIACRAGRGPRHTALFRSDGSGSHQGEPRLKLRTTKDVCSPHNEFYSESGAFKRGKEEDQSTAEDEDSREQFVTTALPSLANSFRHFKLLHLSSFSADILPLRSEAHRAQSGGGERVGGR